MDGTHRFIPRRVDHVLGVRRVQNLLVPTQLTEDIAEEIALRLPVEAGAGLIEEDDNSFGLVLVSAKSRQEREEPLKARRPSREVCLNPMTVISQLDLEDPVPDGLLRLRIDSNDGHIGVKYDSEGIVLFPVRENLLTQLHASSLEFSLPTVVLLYEEIIVALAGQPEKGENRLITLDQCGRLHSFSELVQVAFTLEQLVIREVKELWEPIENGLFLFLRKAFG
jgi:hypothetical protein